MRGRQGVIGPVYFPDNALKAKYGKVGCKGAFMHALAKPKKLQPLLPVLHDLNVITVVCALATNVIDFLYNLDVSSLQICSNNSILKGTKEFNKLWWSKELGCKGAFMRALAKPKKLQPLPPVLHELNVITVF